MPVAVSDTSGHTAQVIGVVSWSVEPGSPVRQQCQRATAEGKLEISASQSRGWYRAGFRVHHPFTWALTALWPHTREFVMGFGLHDMGLAIRKTARLG